MDGFNPVQFFSKKNIYLSTSKMTITFYVTWINKNAFFTSIIAISACQFDNLWSTIQNKDRNFVMLLINCTRYIFKPHIDLYFDLDLKFLLLEIYNSKTLKIFWHPVICVLKPNMGLWFGLSVRPTCQTIYAIKWN